MSLRLDPADLAPLDQDKARASLSGLRIEEVRDPGGADFAACYSMLDGFFGPRGEMEDRSALERFVAERLIVYGEALEGTYHLVGIWKNDELVAVRDCYVDLDRRQGFSIVALSHAYIAPAWRRSGIGAILRAIPVTLARSVQTERLGGVVPTLVSAEMEPVDPANPDTIVRLIAYGRSGFSVLDPRRFRYSQPDFRCLPEARHTGIALLGVVRPMGIPGRALPVALCAAFPTLFHACHRMYLPATQVDPSSQHAFATLGASPDPVALLPLPTSRADLSSLRPLVRGAVLPLYPPGLWGAEPDFGDAGEEYARVAAWGRGATRPD
ncbi:MAG: hypothetical protein EXR71_13580 [Myxococcales bacterium]|nr:hypothetical protein [Myxococcales bacterium]